MKIKITVLIVSVLAFCSLANAALVTNPLDARSWQGASIGTFAALYYGSDTLANRQLVVDNGLMDDGIFNASGYTAATLVANAWSNGVGTGGSGTSLDTTGTGSYAYSITGGSVFDHANGIDNKWFQSSGQVGQTVFDLGFQANKAAVFNTIDHGPLPQESIESTVYLSNDQITWTQAVVERIWMEGYETNLGILWDGFTYAVGTGTSSTFRYASVIHGGPGALISDGDNEINGILGLRSDFTPGGTVPAPGALILAGLGTGFVSRLRRRRAL